MNISAVILFNGEKSIERAIKSVSFCDEILIIADSITEELKIKDKNTRVICHPVAGDFSNQRNWAMDQVKNEWILFLDADEEVTNELAKNFKTLKPKAHAYYIKRRDFFWGKELKYGETKKTRNKGIIRFVRKQSGKWIGKVHEQFVLSMSTPGIDSLNGFINHYPHQTLKEFIADINTYSSLRAKELFDKKSKVNIGHVILYPLGKFLLTYVIYGGFLDGSSGFTYAFLMSFHSFLVRAKLYQYYWERS